MLHLVVGTLGCSKGADYYELDIDANDKSGADRGRGYKMYFPKDGAQININIDISLA